MIEKLRQIVPSSIKKIIKSNKFNALRNNTALTEKQQDFWSQNGFLVLKNFFKTTQLNPINDLVNELWENQSRYPSLVIDIYIGTPQEKRIKFKDAPIAARKFPYKLNDLFLEYPVVREMVAHSDLITILNLLLDGDPLICNGLTFERSSQQPFHFDTFFMPPPVKNKMLATWIALEDVSPDAGPLAYYPGSHKIEPYLFSNGKVNAISEEMPAFYKYINQKLDQLNLKPVPFCPKKGDVFIWHAQLYHSGLPINDLNLTRKSLVTHYFRASDFPQAQIATFGPGKHYLKRSHQKPIQY